MTDTDMLHMAALEAKLTEAEKMLAELTKLLHHAMFINYKDIELAEKLQHEIRNFLGEE